MTLHPPAVRWLLRHAWIPVLFATFLPLAAHAQDELIPPRKTDRKYPRFTWCPIVLDLAFVADGPTATIRFSTNVFSYDKNVGQTVWTAQAIDNIFVAPQDVYEAHLLDSPPPDFGVHSTYNCYFPNPQNLVPKRFHFQDVPEPLPLEDTFDSDPGARWDQTHGALWKSIPGGPSDPGTEDNFPTGCMSLGQDSATPSLQDSAYTSVDVSGLTQGQTYVVSGWWFADGFQENDTFLVVRITGDNATPIVTKTWGALKRSYR